MEVWTEFVNEQPSPANISHFKVILKGIFDFFLYWHEDYFRLHKIVLET